MNLIELTSNFLKNYCLSDHPLLLGLSGGPDSLCLFYCLLGCSIPFHVAHIDHGWREESRDESMQLRQLAAYYQIPFHEKRLDPSALKGNLEAACRLERYRFFKETCEATNCQAVLVGHHADDQLETVLKRLFEGASWTNLSGLRPENEINGVRVLRPFLSISKNDIQNWLKNHQIAAFEDRTNADPRFLRGKMRTSMIPLLSQEFGKEIKSAIHSIGNEAGELRDYFDLKVENFLSSVVKSQMGVYLDLSNHYPESLVELKYLIRKVCTSESISLSRSQLETIVHWLHGKKANHQMTIAGKTAYVDRRRFFILNEIPSLPDFLIPLSLGTFQFGPWKVEVTQVSSSAGHIATSWKDSWLGRLEVIIPLTQVTQFSLGPAKMNAPYFLRSSKISKWWTDHKVPAFIRPIIPVVWLDDTIYHEFLTGMYQKKEEFDKNGWMKITLIF